jgi:DNA-binding transcriptional ArsR family regulator
VSVLDASPGRHHAGAGDTERGAAEAIRPFTAPLRRKALIALGNADLTDHELAQALDEYHYSVAPRRVELRDAGLVEDSGERRPGPRGRLVTVWTITETGRQMLARF